MGIGAASLSQSSAGSFLLELHPCFNPLAHDCGYNDITILRLHVTTDDLLHYSCEIQKAGRGLSLALAMNVGQIGGHKE